MFLDIVNDYSSMTSRGFFLVKIAKSREELNLHLTYNNHCHMTKT
jgi:hypothetical protein